MSVLTRRVRGFRLVDLVAVGLLAALILGLYLAKTIAGSERAEIAQVEKQIETERARIRLLQAENARLEQPARIEHLAETYLGLAPVSIKHEITTDALASAATHPPPAPAKPIDPSPDPAYVPGVTAPPPAAPVVVEPHVAEPAR